MNKIFDAKNYPNLLDELNLSYDEMIKKLDQMNYVPPPRCTDSTEEEYNVEHVLKLPFFNKAFLHFVSLNHTFPTENEFVQQYFEDNREYFKSYSSPAYITAIRNRAMRSYPSLIRDVMFAYLLRDKLEGNGAKILYNERLDAFENIDVMIINRYNWGIHLFTKTKRAQAFRSEKDGRHDDDFSNVYDIDFMFDLGRKGRKPHGNVLLYDETDVQILLELLKQEVKNKNLAI